MTAADPVATAPGDLLEPARAVADAVLYEGYLLYPYRRSSGKQRVRWQFGVLAPAAFVAAHGVPQETVAGSADAWQQQTEVLLEAAPDAVVHLRLRFLQVQQRVVQRPAPGGGWETADAVTAGSARWLTFDEAVAREHDVRVPLAELLAGGRTEDVRASAAELVEPLPEGAGRLLRRREAVTARLELTAERAAAPFPLTRLRVVVGNTAAGEADEPRAAVLRRSLVAAHTLLGVRGGRFVSLLEPPEWAAAAAAGCTNRHTFPVLAGAGGRSDVVLSAPIVLYDHPRIAPESPGPLFDSGEIDEILSLRTQTLTEAEKAEARATDPRAAALLDRVDGLPEEVLARLHGAIRSLRPVGPPSAGSAPADPPGTGGPDAADRPWWVPGADDALRPEVDAVLVDGVPVRAGSRVRLRPRPHGADAHDLFLAGRTAVVRAVVLDVDGSRHVAVTLDADPGADLHAVRRRFWYFAPDEVQPLPPVARP